MNHVVGSAIRFEAEVEPVLGTGVSVESIRDPNGALVLSNLSMTFSVDEPEIAFGLWQSTIANVIGRYTYIIKAVNGAKESFAKGYFYLESRT